MSILKHKNMGAVSEMNAALNASSAAAMPNMGSSMGSAGLLSMAEPADYFALMKPRVMSLVVFTACIGLLIAPAQLPLWNSIAAIICIAAGAGASGALNMWYDADIDALMTRTKKRPIPRGRITPRAALGFGTIISAASIWSLALATNWLAAGLLGFTIIFYLGIYTMWLKRRTPQNIVIGGAAGAFPPMIGYVAAMGSIDVNAVILFMIIFIWTPPHFWALALYKVGDYAKVGIPMLPNVAGAAVTRRHIMAYSLLLAGITALPVASGLAGGLYSIFATLLNLAFLVMAYKVWQSRAGDRGQDLDEASLYAVQAGNRAARNLFAFSIIYLFAIFGALALDVILLKGVS